MFSDATKSIDEVRSQIDDWKRRVRMQRSGDGPIPPPIMPRFVICSGFKYDMTVSFHQGIIRRQLHDDHINGGMFAAAQRGIG